MDMEVTKNPDFIYELVNKENQPEPAAVELVWHGLHFNSDFLFVSCAETGRIHFTRHERIILRLLAQHPGVLITRNRILDVLQIEGVPSHDRNIDFLICRIRKKIDESPKKPKFIATLYGEGYAWLANEPTY